MMNPGSELPGLSRRKQGRPDQKDSFDPLPHRLRQPAQAGRQVTNKVDGPLGHVAQPLAQPMENGRYKILLLGHLSSCVSVGQASLLDRANKDVCATDFHSFAGAPQRVLSP
jgi:hypothetical protein